MTGIKIGMISLGCAKNRVDTELMLGELNKAGYVFTADPSEATIIIINTCGFIESAKQESIDTILEMVAYKKTAAVKAVIVTGCLSGRYQSELAAALPEVDVFLGITAQNDIVGAVQQALQGEKLESYGPANVFGDYNTRILTTSPWYAYVKISEGCNNRCAYCAIPYIRGNLLSRPLEEIVAEVRALLGRGVKEVILVAQDTTKYGIDLYGESSIAPLIDALAVLPGLKWLRLLYCYPDGITDELLQAMCRHETVVKYIDMPVQHMDDDVLLRMNRTNTKKSTYAAVQKIREYDADFILRTTLIAGFPGESELQYQHLLEGVEDLAFDRLGVFAYSREEGTPAAVMQGQVPEDIKVQRANGAMVLQKEISLRKNKARIGRSYEVVIEGYDDKAKLYYGRSYGEAPGIDGAVLIEAKQKLYSPGQFVWAKITDASHYELYATLRENAL